MRAAPPLLLPVLNHLLEQEAWARARLAPHAGKVACLDAGALVLRLQVTVDGKFASAAPETAANVTVRLKLSDLPRMMNQPAQAFSHVSIDGDADFASSLSQVGQNLRWEAEEDLARWVGDIAAMRIVAGARSVFETARATQQSLAENVAEYLTEENPVLVRPLMVGELAADLNRMRDDLERLIKRIEKLESRMQ